MCASCGCGTEEHHSHHDHPHHDSDGHHHHPTRISFEQEILAKNDRIAAENRAWLSTREIAAFNLMSSPGAGKTTLLERTLRHFRGAPLAVIEGDQETARDAERVRAAGANAVQINTGSGCHLDANMVAAAMRGLRPVDRSLLFIENVGNLVCPALFDLGERARVLIASVTEGEDKPLKYPHMFRAADLLVLNKIDLIGHVEFDPDRFLAYSRRVNPRLDVLTTSATRGDGLEEWYDWLTRAQATA